MSDYFDHVERSLREAVAQHRNVPWYARVLSRRSRPALALVLVLLGGGSALAATGVLRTGTSVSSEVKPLAYAREGTVIRSSVRVLPIRVPDPQGGPPWGLRVARTSRGLLCLQVGRVVNGRIGVLGQDGAFDDDGAFHPLASGYLSGVGCATEDARGDAFINEQLHGLPAGGLIDTSRRDATGGCYSTPESRSSCPTADLREVYFGMLGPDALSITALGPDGHSTRVVTVAPSGAYLVVLAHTQRRCVRGMLACFGGRGGTFSPTLTINEAISGVAYKNAPPCRLPTPEQASQQLRRRELRLRETLRVTAPDIYARLYRPGSLRPAHLAELSRQQLAALQALRASTVSEPSCPAVGFVPRGEAGGRPTPSQLASPVSAHLEQASRYCEHDGETIIPCTSRIPRGDKPLRLDGPPRMLLVIDFTARHAVRNFDSHYEIETAAPKDPRDPEFQDGCGGTFGPTQTNLRAGQHVRYTSLVNRHCHGTTRISVSYVTVDGPSTAAPVPGEPGQQTIPVGHTTIKLP